MKLTRSLPRVPRLAALLAALLLGSLSASAQTGRLTYDAYAGPLPNSPKVGADLDLDLASGEVRTLRVKHLRNARNSGRNDLILTVEGLTGQATFWLVKDGATTLSIPPLLPGADLELVRVQCMQFATIEDSRFLWDALGGSPAQLSKKFADAARAGAEGAAQELRARAEEALEHLTEAGVEARAKALDELEARIDALLQAESAAVSGLGKLTAEQLPELDAALRTTAELNGDALPRALEALRDVRAELRRGLRLRVDLPGDVDTELTLRLGLSLEGLASELEALLGGTTAGLTDLLADTSGALQPCLALGQGVRDPLAETLQSVTGRVRAAHALLRGVDRGLRDAVGREVAGRLARLTRSLGELLADLERLGVAQQEVVDAQEDFERSYRKLSGTGSPLDSELGRLLSGLPSLDPQQTQADLEVHLANTERYGSAIAARDRAWQEAARGLGRCATEATELAQALPRLRPQVRGAKELIAMLGELGRLTLPEPPRALADGLRDCVEAQARAARSLLTRLAQLADTGRGTILTPGLRRKAEALRVELAAVIADHVALVRAVERLGSAKLQLVDSCARLTLASGTALLDSGFEDRIRLVEDRSRELRSAAQDLQGALERGRPGLTQVGRSAQAFVAELARIPAAGADVRQRWTRAAREVVDLSVEVNGLESALARTSEGLQQLLADLAGLRTVVHLFGPGESAAKFERLLAEAEESRRALVQNLTGLRGADGDLAAGLTLLGSADPRDLARTVDTLLLATHAALEGEGINAGALGALAGMAGGQIGLGPPGAIVGAELGRRAGERVSVQRPSGGVAAAESAQRLERVRGDLERLAEAAQAWKLALERTPERIAALAHGNAQGALSARLAELRRLAEGIAERSAEARAWADGLVSEARLSAAVAPHAKLPSGAAQVLSGIGDLLKPGANWTLSAIGKRIDDARALLVSLEGAGQAAAGTLQASASADLARIADAADTAGKAIVDFGRALSELEAQLASAAGSPRVGSPPTRRSPAATPTPRAVPRRR